MTLPSFTQTRPIRQKQKCRPIFLFPELTQTFTHHQLEHGPIIQIPTQDHSLLIGITLSSPYEHPCINTHHRKHIQVNALPWFSRDLRRHRKERLQTHVNIQIVAEFWSVLKSYQKKKKRKEKKTHTHINKAEHEHTSTYLANNVRNNPQHFFNFLCRADMTQRR